MADEDKGQGTQGGTEGGDDKGIQLPEDLKPEQAEALLKHPALVSAIDRRVTQAVETNAKRLTEKAEQEKAEIERKALEEKGDFQKLFEQAKAQLDEIQSQQAARENRDNALKALCDAGLPTEVATALLDNPGEGESFADVGGRVKSVYDKAVEAEVLKRLSTGDPPRRSTSTPPGGGPSTVRFADLRTTADKVKFIAEHGQDGYQQIVDQHYAEQRAAREAKGNQ